MNIDAMEKSAYITQVQNNGDLSDEGLSLGIDIGTTTISAVVLEIYTGRQVKAFTLPNDSAIKTANPSRHEQDVGRIRECIDQLVDSFLNTYSHIRAIGLTGQMHGIVYVDAQGKAVSPLFTWQDSRADEELCHEIGGGVHPGYGMATHVYNVRHGLVPIETSSLCTVMDYIAMHLTGRVTPLMHPSCAASLGLYHDGAFQTAGLNLPPMQWPDIGEGIVGFCHGIPVMAALGDNQASFFAADAGEGTVLINYGTGSQISMIDPQPHRLLSPLLERRPYVGGRHLLVGSALCGGRAYAVLERFFRLYSGQNQYDRLNALAQQALDESITPLCVRTTFCGTREDPMLLGCIEQISESNLTPQALVLGVLQGMANELHDMLLLTDVQPKTLIASGNAVQRNPAFQQVLSRTFGLPVNVSTLHEEAAVGAARYAIAALLHSVTKIGQ